MKTILTAAVITIFSATLLSGQIPTLLMPGFQPFNSGPYLTPTSSPTTSMWVNWNTAVPESSRVAYGSSQLEDTVWLSEVTTYHHVRLADLRPGHWYYYRIIPDGDIRTFRTFPLDQDSFDFVIYGDTRSDSAAHQAVVDRILECSPRFVINTGDLVKSGASTPDWVTFFNTTDELLASTVYMPVPGNHENPYWQYDTLFSLPDAEYFYSVNFANIHMIFLDTQHEMRGAQGDWLRNDLIKADDDPLIDWIFVIFHRPPYSAGSHGSQKDVRDAWCSLFEKYGVDMVFSGHDHHYERMTPINNVIYMIIGGGGAPLYEVGRSEWTAFAQSIHHLCRIKIMRNKLALETITAEGQIIDSLRLEK
ncbi:MAG TPA: metallophosphoesterase family protein [bacterium]